MFADQGDIDRYNAAKAQGLTDNEAFQIGDNGVGSKYLGGLSTTNLYGIAIPEIALHHELGNNYAAWRKARVDVINPQSGKRLRVPIVDLGPGAGPQSKGVIADFTPGVDRYFGNDGGGKKLMFKLVPNAGPDVNKNPGDFADEQAALAQGFDARSVEKTNQRMAPSYTLTPVAPAAQASADQANTYDTSAQLEKLNQISAQAPNIVGLYKSLDQPITGTVDPVTQRPVGAITDAMRKSYQENIKTQIVGLMKDKYPDLTDEQAWAKAQTDPNALDVGADFWNKFVGSFQQLSPLLQQATGVRAEQIAPERILWIRYCRREVMPISTRF